MKLTKPDYYDLFSCIGKDCKDNCCKVGWDIVVDKKTISKYNKFCDKTSKIFRQNLIEDKDDYLIRLNDGICPFLNKDGLCSIILERGEDFVGDICRNHPRFFNYLNDREECGLGLCCEEVVRIFLEQKDSTRFVTVGSGTKLKGNDKIIFNQRESAFAIIYKNARDFVLCKDMLLQFFNICDVPLEEIISQVSFEFLDDNFSKLLYNIRDCKTFDFDDLELTNLLIYFIYRYSFENNYTKTFNQVIGFAIFSVMCINSLCTEYNSKLMAIKEYSKEIEYSIQNVQSVFNLLK